VEVAALFEQVPEGSALDSDGPKIEHLFDEFADEVHEATQLAGKIRTSLNALAQGARVGSVSSAEAQIRRLSESIADLRERVAHLSQSEQSLGIRGDGLNLPRYVEELRAELGKKGVEAVKGPDPYWLVYPAWFTVARNSKGSVEVVVNGDRLDSVRPAEVAARIAEVVKEKFHAKRFADLLISVRDLLRRAGAANSVVALEDIYEVLALEAGGRTARKKDFSKASFYYSVHRLAEELERTPSLGMDFPVANRSPFIFFTREGDGRRYLTVDFAGRR
jgi:hypothetical protein